MLCTHHCLGVPYPGDTIKATLTITESPLPNKAGAGLLKTDGSFTSNQIADNKYEIFMEQAHTQNSLVAESALRMVHDVIQIKCGLPYGVICPSMKYEYGSRVPKPGYEAEPSTRVVGSRDPYEYWGRWHSFGKTYLICIIAQILENCVHTPYWHSVRGGQCE